MCHYASNWCNKLRFTSIYVVLLPVLMSIKLVSENAPGSGHNMTAIWLFLSDRTNGRAYATVLRLSVCLFCRLWRYVLWLNGAS